MTSEIFTDGFGRIAFVEGMVRIELTSLSGGEPAVKQHLIMTLPAFLQSFQRQQGVVSKFEAAGMIRAVPSAGLRSVAATADAAPAANVPEPPAAAAARPTAAGGPPRSPNFSDA